MSTLLTLFPIRTEAGEVIGAESLADVFLGAARSERAEALVVVWTWRQARIGIYVEI